MNKQKSIDMLNGPMLGKILMFALPLALSSILQLLFNAADTIVVGKFAGNQALAAVVSNGALINLIVNAFLGLSVGANVVVARYRGSGNVKKIHLAVQTAILVSILSGVLLAFIGFFVAPKMLLLMSVPEDVLPLSSLYLKLYFLGMPFMMLYNFGAAILRSIGDTRRPLIYLTIAGVINVLLNLVFVIVFDMSVAGVAIATVISQVVSSLLVLRCLTQTEEDIRVDLKQLAIDVNCLKEIVKIGMPAGLQGCVFSLSNVVIQSSINSFGSIMVAGNSAALNIEGFIYVTMNAFHQSAVTFSSQNYGAKKFERCDKALILSGASAMVVGALLGLIFMIFKEPLLSLYTSDSEVLNAGFVRMGMLFKFQPINGLMDVMVGGMRGIGYSTLPTVVSLSGACVFRLIWIATIFKANPTIQMLYTVYPVSWIITTTIHICCYMWARKQIRK